MNGARNALAAATLLAGVAAAGYALFGPTVQSQTGVGIDGTRIGAESSRSLVADGLDPLAAALNAGLTILAIAAAYLAWSGDGSPRRTRRAIACAIYTPHPGDVLGPHSRVAVLASGAPWVSLDPAFSLYPQSRDLEAAGALRSCPAGRAVYNEAGESRGHT